MPAGEPSPPRVADSAPLVKRWSRRVSFNLLAAESQPGESLRTTNICIKGSGLTCPWLRDARSVKDVGSIGGSLLLQPTPVRRVV